MIEERILDTLRFFDLQDLPLTLFELHKFLIAPMSGLRGQLDSDFGLKAPLNSGTLSIDEVSKAVDELVAKTALGTSRGYYFLPPRGEIVEARLNNYAFGIVRESLIKKYLPALRHIPFVRGAALAGSQALGQERKGSDIDLLVITDEQYMWTARTLITLYFHILRVRRHGKFIANRFCLNHYIAGDKVLTAGRNLYTASEYAKLRPVVYEEGIDGFTGRNLFWLKSFFPNLASSSGFADNKRSSIQRVLERLFRNPGSLWLEQKLKMIQKKRIHTDQYVRVEEDELSFHPQSKQEKLLSAFFKLQQ